MENKRRHWWAAIAAEDMSWWIKAHFNRLVGRLRVYVFVTMNAVLCFFYPRLIRAMDACGNPRIQCCWVNKSSLPWFHWEIFSNQQHLQDYLLYCSAISSVLCAVGSVVVTFSCSCSAFPSFRALVKVNWSPQGGLLQNPSLSSSFCSAMPSPHEPYSAF